MANGQALPETTSNPLAGIAALLQTLGGTQQTTNAGDTGPLRNVLAQLQAQDPNALLQSVFQQAGGQIPGLQQAYANAIGARSGGNSAVQAALNELLKQTTIAGQAQVVQQQQQNLATQQQAAANIANATRGTKATSGTNLGASAKMLGVLQLLSMLMPDTANAMEGSIRGAVDKIGESISNVFNQPATTGAAVPAAAPMGTGITAGGGGAPGFQFTADMFGGGSGGDFMPAFTGYNTPDYSLAGGGADFGGLGFQTPSFDFGPSGFENYQPVDFSNIFTGGGGLGLSGAAFPDYDFDY